MKVAVLFARSDSIYKSLPCCDVYDQQRDALTYSGNTPIIAHPPCRMWGRLRAFARPVPGEAHFAFFAVRKVRENGGVLEHPANSRLWDAAGLPLPGETDEYGGWTLPISQFWWGHRANKPTWLYIVGVSPFEIPSMPLVLGDAPCVVETTSHSKGNRPAITKREREATPVDLVLWLIELATLATAKTGAQRQAAQPRKTPNPRGSQKGVRDRNNHTVCVVPVPVTRALSPMGGTITGISGVHPKNYAQQLCLSIG